MKIREEFQERSEESVWSEIEYGESASGSFNDLYVKWLERRIERSEKEEGLDFPDIRNKLSSICHTIALLEKGEFELAMASLNQSKKSVNYLAGREVYKDINKETE